MVSTYEIDTKLIEFLLRIAFTMSIFSLVFLFVLIPKGMQYKFVETMYISFVTLFVLFLGAVFGLFIKWFSKYKTSLFRIR
jgi:hypothetical protein